jgi:PRTRC genetic system protein E
MVRNRTVMITVAALDEKTLQVNVLPRKVKDDPDDVLTVPLCCTGTAEELDQTLVTQLREFVDIHGAASSNLATIKHEIAAAEKAAREEAQNRKSKVKGKATEPARPAPEGAEPPAPPPMMSLFDQPSAAPAEAPQQQQQQGG